MSAIGISLEKTADLSPSAFRTAMLGTRLVLYQTSMGLCGFPVASQSAFGVEGEEDGETPWLVFAEFAIFCPQME
jgi:hypothetical protein